jgi:F-type H+-transporting ATPase subunit b
MKEEIITTIISILNALIPVAHASEEAVSAVEQSLPGMLGINWKGFIGQLVNFAIVLFVLWKWVFGPLGQKLEERTTKIEQSLKNADEIELKHRQAEEHRQAEIEKARIEASEIIVKAQKTAEQTKEEIVAEARASTERMMEQTKAQMASEKNKLMAEVREEAASLVVAATEKILREKIDTKKDESLIKESLQSVKGK